jgi:tRNA pseudouridine38-40 synthase
VEKTIEGDLFAAFIKAGAISKANANDPKKSGLVRCARTDKGVHAAGNVINLKLIIEEPDIMQKINEQLPPQIRLWHIQRTTGSFNCYQSCDSRWYEYLLPSHCLLPPHPSTYLAKKLVEYAAETGDTEEYQKRQQEVAGWWEEAEEKYIQPVLNSMDETIKAQVLQAMYDTDSLTEKDEAASKTEGKGQTEEDPEATETPEEREARIAKRKALDAATKELRQAYWTAKEAYRVSPERIARLKEALGLYCGTKNYHNFTVRKSSKDPSAKRHIKSFVVNETPIVINGTEWLSLKVHGQSFMMHQIRKMVGLASLVVRCGSPPKTIYDALGNDVYNIPKAPGLGLLLERPVFDHYNSKAAQFGRDKIEFDIVQKEMDEFKQREIYDRIFREEMESHT